MVRSEVERSYGGVTAAHRRAERRTRLLTAGRNLWGGTGVAAVTVRGVCKSAGLTDRYFYEHFTGIEDLLVAVADEVRDQLLGTLVRTGLSSPGGPEQRLNAALRAMLDLVDTDPHLHRVAAADLSSAPVLAERRRVLMTAMAAVVVQYAPEELGIEPDAEWLTQAAIFVTGGVSQLVEAWLDGTLEASTAELAERTTTLLLRVLAPVGSE